LRERSIPQRHPVPTDLDDQPSPARPAPDAPEEPSNIMFLPLEREDHLRELERTLRVLQREPNPDDLTPRREQTPPRDPGRPWTPRPMPALGEPRPGNPSGGNMYIEGFRVPRSLEPQRLPPPPTEPRSRYGRRAISLLIMSGVAAPLAYFAVFGWGSMSPPSKGAKLASADIPVLMPVAAGQGPSKAVPDGAEIKPIAAVEQSASTPATIMARHETKSTPPAVPQTTTSPQTSTVGSAAANADNGPNPRDKSVLRQLDADEVAVLMKQGGEFIAAGDVVTARTVFQRAAEAGDAKAALALGATYDPALLARLGLRSVEGDADKARSWYERAKDFGSSEASRRLEVLASR
jgi:hypothetical protein